MHINGQPKFTTFQPFSTHQLWWQISTNERVGFLGRFRRARREIPWDHAWKMQMGNAGFPPFLSTLDNWFVIEFTPSDCASAQLSSCTVSTEKDFFSDYHDEDDVPILGSYICTIPEAAGAAHTPMVVLTYVLTHISFPSVLNIRRTRHSCSVVLDNALL